MSLILRKNEQGSSWYPVTVSNYEKLLIKVIRQGFGYPHPYALRKNICYNLQYVEYLETYLSQLQISTVLVTQTWKTFILVGCSIVESLLKYLLIRHGIHSMDNWELDFIAKGNERKVEDKLVKIDSHVFRKLKHQKYRQMDFDAMIKKGKSKAVLGSDKTVYNKLNHLRDLRNRIHLQKIEHPTDTDWNAFNTEDFQTMAQVLHSVFTSNIFHPSAEEKTYFSYLEKYL